MKLFQILLATLGVIAAFVTLLWIIQGNDFILYKTFAPGYEEARRETFEQSKAYNDGMEQELQRMQLDYVKTNSQEEKDALAAVILHRVAGYDETKLSSDLRAFVHQLKVDRGVAQ